MKNWAAKEIVYKKTKDLIPYARNSRKHSPEQVKKLRASIREWGWTMPVLIDEENNIIAGHGRIMAAQEEEIKEVPCMVAKGWSEAKKKAYVIADNKLTDISEFDMDTVALEIQDIADLDDNFDLSLLGFEDFEIDDLLNEPEEGLTDEDEVPELPEVPVSKEGDIWILGNHRLMCGDSTDAATVALLMDGQKADMVFTDPPYNIDYQDMTGKHKKIKNDKMSDDDFVKFLQESIMGCETMYVCCSWQYAHLFKLAMENISRKPKAMIVWDKVNPAQNLDKYYKQHEIIYYYGDFGGSKTLRGDVWTLKRQKNTVHPTMKPVELIETVFSDQPNKKVVYDGFGGSGSTLIAAEKTNRKCYMMELDPHYCDVIVKRWQDFSGKEAVNENGKTFAEVSNGSA